MKTKIFSNGLVVKHRKSAILFEDRDGKQEKTSRFSYYFTTNEFRDFLDYIKQIADETWGNIVPKCATSPSSDYDEYYDRKYDDNGYLSIRENSLIVRAPYWSVDTLYQFNKPKIQSFMYDLDKKLSTE